MTGIILPEETRVDFVALKVANLTLVSQWYQQVARLDLLRQNGSTIYLGTRLNQQVLVVLHQITGLQAQQPVTGLDHFAILLPNPGALGAAYRIVAKDQTVTTAFQTGYREGFIAHDPEGNGVASSECELRCQVGILPAASPVRQNSATALETSDGGVERPK